MQIIENRLELLPSHSLQFELVRFSDSVSNRQIFHFRLLSRCPVSSNEIVPAAAVLLLDF